MADITVSHDASEYPYKWAVVADGRVFGRAVNRKDADRMARRVSRGLPPIALPAHRPRRDPSAARVVRSYRLHPDTAARIVAEAQRTGESQGQVIDRIVAAL